MRMTGRVVVRMTGCVVVRMTGTSGCETESEGDEWSGRGNEGDRRTSPCEIEKPLSSNSGGHVFKALNQCMY